MRQLLLFFNLIAFTCCLSAQEFLVETPQYEIIDYTYNRIQVPGNDSSRLNAFFHKFDSLFVFGTGKINILHIGGSHVQADLFSNQVRRNLDAINQNYQPPRGFIFPFKVAKTNNPTNYTVSYKGNWESVRNVQRNRDIPLGVGGIAVYTSDPQAEITVHLNTDESDQRWSFDELKLIGYPDNGSGVRPVLKYQDSTYIDAEFDSISKTYLFSLPETTDSFTVCFLQEDSTSHTFFLDGFIPEKDEEGIVYHAIGVNGASVGSYLSMEHFEDELPLISPDLVIFGIGVNDASGRSFSEDTFISNYNSLIRKIVRVSPDCAFIFITNNDSFRKISRRRYAVNRNGLIAQKAFYELAKQHKGGVWDQFAVMGGLSSIQQWEKAGLATADKVHFTRAGYVLIGNLFYNALMKYYLYNDIE